MANSMKALLSPSHDEHKSYVRLMDEVERLYLRRSETVYDNVMDYWDLYLAQQDDPRDPVDEQWRSKIFVPLPSSNTITKASQITDILTSADPMYLIGANNDPDIFDYCFHSQRIPPKGANRGRYRNPALDRLLDQARAEMDRDKRRHLLFK